MKSPGANDELLRFRERLFASMRHSTSGISDLAHKQKNALASGSGDYLGYCSKKCIGVFGVD